MSLPHSEILNRTRDTDEYVRKVAYKFLAKDMLEEMVEEFCPGKSNLCIFIITVKHQNMDFVKSFPTNFTTELPENFQANPFPPHNAPPSFGHLFPHVENFAGHEPDTVQLVPGFGISRHPLNS